MRFWTAYVIKTEITCIQALWDFERTEYFNYSAHSVLQLAREELEMYGEQE